MSYQDEYVKRLDRLRLLQSLGMSATPTASKADLANFILQKARSDFSVSGPTSAPPAKKNKSILQKSASTGLKILDILGRPLSAVAGAAMAAEQDTSNQDLPPLGTLAKGAWEGLSGKTHNSFIDVLQQHSLNGVESDPKYQALLNDPKYSAGGVAEAYKQDKIRSIEGGRLQDVLPGLAADFALDPLNAVGTGLVTKPLKALRGVGKATADASLAEAAVGALPSGAEGLAAAPDPRRIFVAGPGTKTVVNEAPTNIPTPPVAAVASVPKASGLKLNPIVANDPRGMLQQPPSVINPKFHTVIDTILQKYAGQSFDEAAVRQEIDNAVRAVPLAPGESNFNHGSLFPGPILDQYKDAVIGALKQPTAPTNTFTPPVAQVAKLANDPGISPGVMGDVNWARAKPEAQQMPPINLKSPARPDKLNVEGTDVSALRGKNLQKFTEKIKSDPKYATLSHVFNKDIKASDYADLTKSRVVNETAQVVDQAAKGNPATAEFLSAGKAGPLTPLARKYVDIAVIKTGDEIVNSIADPVKAKAAGKQPRHPVFNAPTQNNLSNKLTTAAREQFQAESLNPKTGSQITKGASPKYVAAVYDRYINMLRNAEQSLIERGTTMSYHGIKGDDAFYPRGGIKPDSPYLRLSDVLDRLPPSIAQRAILGPTTKDKTFPSIILRAVTGDKKALAVIARDNPELMKALQAVDWAPLMVKDYALRVIDTTNRMKPALDTAANLIHTAKDLNASDTGRAVATAKVVRDAKAGFKNEMPVAKDSFFELLNKMANPKENIIDQIIQNRKSKLAAGVAGGVNGQRVAQAPRIEITSNITEQILKEEIAPEATLKQAATDPVLAEKAAESGIFSTVLSWIKPDYGYKELRPTLIKNISARKASAATRANQFTQILNKVPVGEHLKFWKEAVGAIPVAPSHAEAVQDLQRAFGNMFGESGLEAEFAGASSVARSGVSIKSLNEHLRIAGIKDFQFTKEVMDPITGKMVRFNGSQMLQTWRNYLPKNENDLRGFVFGMTQAVENVMVEYSSFANMGSLWGSKKFRQGYVKVTNMHPAIDEMYFPKDIVSQIGKFSEGLDEFYKPLATNQMVKLYDTALRTWKSGVTIYSPSHHVRNLNGDIFMGWLDGLSNPIYYSRSAKVLKANHNHYSDIKPNKNPLSDILGHTREADIIGEMMGQTKTRIPRGESVIATAKAGGKNYKMTVDQVYQMAFRHGLLPHSNVIEDMPGAETMMETLANKFHPGKAGIFQPAGGKISKGAKQLSESREHYVRMAHYLFALEHTKAKDLPDLFEKAAGRVRKYHPDGLDLTSVEKRVLRRLFPFYSWTRKAIPLLAEGLIKDPAKIMAYPKVMSAWQEQNGIDSSTSDPWPEDQLFPDWLSGNVTGPIFDSSSMLSKAIARSDSEVGYSIVNPGTPATDVLNQYVNNPMAGIGNSITPFAKIPAELMFGQELLSGAPIADKTQYLDKQIPLLSTTSRLTNGLLGTGLLEGGQLKPKETQPANIAALLNYLTGAGILDTGRYQKGGEFDLKARIANAKKQGG